jgi:hypothetical protein
VRLIGGILVLFFLGAGLSAEAGVVVFNNGAVLVTISQTEKDGQLTVKLASGDATYTLDQVAWYTKDASVDSLWAAAQAAVADGKSGVGALLAHEASYREPANSGPAKQLVVQHQERMAESRTGAPAAAGSPGFAKLPGAANPTGGAEPEAGSAASSEPTEVGAHGWPVEAAISAEDLRVNAMVVGIFGLVILFTLWKMTASVTQ